MINCVVVDDEPPALELLKRYVEKNPILNLVGAYANPNHFLEEGTKGINLVFLDINMPDLTGLQLSRLLPEEVKVIFTTAYAEYAIESYRVAALDYLVKPISYSEFYESTLKARDYFELQNKKDAQDNYMFVKADYKLHKILFSEILFIKNIKDYVVFYLKNGEKLMALMSLKSIGETLPKNFLKVHRSFIVNTEEIALVERNRIYFGNEIVPVADAYKEVFQSFLRSRSVN